MNLFLLHRIASQAALWHCDKHCVKMILECCQLLCTAQWRRRSSSGSGSSNSAPPSPSLLSPPALPLPPHRRTHTNHPCAVWVRARPEHYRWAAQLGVTLCSEYTRRYGRQHRCEPHLRAFEALGPPQPPHCYEDETYEAPLRKRATTGLPEGCEWFDCAIADHLFDACAVYDAAGRLNAVESYRNYYCTKTFKMKWNRGESPPPYWYTPPPPTPPQNGVKKEQQKQRGDAEVPQRRTRSMAKKEEALQQPKLQKQASSAKRPRAKSRANREKKAKKTE